ncbi:MAG: hypothetical protein OEY51_14765, partial [Cyclobacteriaceae bacterium]|nr:hypothetical protein [Cyclobacteriaceae bacterium]
MFSWIDTSFVTLFEVKNYKRPPAETLYPYRKGLTRIQRRWQKQSLQEMELFFPRKSYLIFFRCPFKIGH